MSCGQGAPRELPSGCVSCARIGNRLDVAGVGPTTAAEDGDLGQAIDQLGVFERELGRVAGIQGVAGIQFGVAPARRIGSQSA